MRIGISKCKIFNIVGVVALRNLFCRRIAFNRVFYRKYNLLDGMFFTSKRNGSLQPVRFRIAIIFFNLRRFNAVRFHGEFIVRRKFKFTVACAKNLFFGAKNDAKFVFVSIYKRTGRKDFFAFGQVVPLDCIRRGAKVVALSVRELVIRGFAVYGILDTADVDFPKHTAVARRKGNGDKGNRRVVEHNENVYVANVSARFYPIGKTMSIKGLNEEGHGINAAFFKYGVFIHKTADRIRPLNTVYEVKLCAARKFFIGQQCVITRHCGLNVLRILGCARSLNAAKRNTVYVLRFAGSELVGCIYDFVVVLHHAILSCTQCFEGHRTLVTVDVTPNMHAAIISKIACGFNRETEAFKRLNSELYLVACACNVMFALGHLSPSVIFVNIPQVIGFRNPHGACISHLYIFHVGNGIPCDRGGNGYAGVSNPFVDIIKGIHNANRVNRRIQIPMGYHSFFAVDDGVDSAVIGFVT